MLSPGIKIYEYRLLLKMSQAELAQRAGLAQANLSNIEKGKRDFTVSTLFRIASALEVKPSHLIEPAGQEGGFGLTRVKIEKLAGVILNPGAKASKDIQELAVLFRQTVPEMSARLSIQKINLAWAKLRQKLTEAEIKGVLSRVEDARQRSDAKKAD